MVVTEEDHIPMLELKVNIVLEAMTHWIESASQSLPSNYKDGSGAVYMPSLVLSPFLPPKGGSDNALYSPKVFWVVV